jgi:hypothetical protein
LVSYSHYKSKTISYSSIDHDIQILFEMIVAAASWYFFNIYGPSSESLHSCSSYIYDELWFC